MYATWRSLQPSSILCGIMSWALTEWAGKVHDAVVEMTVPPLSKSCLTADCRFQDLLLRRWSSLLLTLPTLTNALLKPRHYTGEQSDLIAAVLALKAVMKPPRCAMWSLE